ncbi:GNAT family N-acetyltransferase [Actinomadura chibensis]|uniref:GNAT family N-acetyltransferase n=1 Tax=Actinomadura chibensis TaxID=392828 RepID=A0A5D0NJV1_9ACTN|nr:GNAT family N-acetyltransferase [Actinomadura chibensis]TYB44750.1 GNAT family N-acetyltransferase [Actinomadura chibensis]
MAWTLTDDLDAFRAHTDELLRGDPVAHTVPLTVVDTLLGQEPDRRGDVLFGWWPRAGTPAATFLRTGPYPAMLSAMPERAARELADALREHAAAVSEANCPRAVAGPFAEAWTSRSGAASGVAMRQRLYRLDGLAAPDPPPAGGPRVAGPGDRDLVLAWFGAFSWDGGHATIDPAVVEGRVAKGCVTLWEEDGRPVAMAGRSPTVAGMTRIAHVYTPPAHRRRGYGAAVTAAITREAQDAGAEHVVLFTDLANPTSNAIYWRLGFRPVEDRVVLTFG